MSTAGQPLESGLRRETEGAGGACCVSPLWPAFPPGRVVGEFLSAEQFARCCRRIWSMDPRSPLAGDRGTALRHAESVYCKKDHLPSLWRALQRTRNRVVVVASESAYSVRSDEDLPAHASRWFSTNSEHDNVLPLPLGLGNSYCEVTAKAPLLAASAASAKTRLLYVNFRPETNAEVRAPLWEKFGSAAWRDSVTREACSPTIEAYVRSLASHRFVLCPRGRGVDTHRMWEALYVGAVPVVQSHAALDGFRDLPILFVDDLLGVEPAMLEQAYLEIRGRDWKLEKLFLPYWREIFQRACETTGPRLSWKEFTRLRFRGSSVFRWNTAARNLFSGEKPRLERPMPHV